MSFLSDNIYPDTPSDKQIKKCIKGNNSFYVIAGAGSGKTTSLIKALDFVRYHWGNTLRKKGQKVACITFTNSAVGVIRKRLNSDALFLISTLHSFFWSEIRKYQNEIRQILKEHIIPKQINKKKEKDKGTQSQNDIATREVIQKLQNILSNIHQIEEFAYDENGSRNYETGRLDHDDIIDIAELMINKMTVFRKILGQKYPYIFIDEAQDTFINIISAINLMSEESDLPIVGYFGDPMQQIYESRAGNFEGPKGSIKISKTENYRCSSKVIELLNSFRTDIKQTPAGNNSTGSVRIILVKAEQGCGKRGIYTNEQAKHALEKFDLAVKKLNWSDEPEVKRLFLVRQMIAKRLGFLSLNKLFTGKFASKSAKESYESGENYLLKPFVEFLVLIVRFQKNKETFKAFQMMLKHSPLLNPTGKNAKKKIKDVLAEASSAIDQLVKIWDKEKIKNILILSNKLRLIALSNRLAEQLQKIKRTEEYNESEHSKEKGDWLADNFFSMLTSELEAYTNFINEKTPFSTQHGVKGEEHEKVLVFYDDTEANWNQFNFIRMLAPTSAGKNPTDGQKNRSKKLAYVSFSRAKEDLGIILFTPNPSLSKSELVKAGYFSKSQVEIL